MRLFQLNPLIEMNSVKFQKWKGCVEWTLTLMFYWFFSTSLVPPWGCSHFSSAVPTLFCLNKYFGLDSSELCAHLDSLHFSSRRKPVWTLSPWCWPDFLGGLWGVGELTIQSTSWLLTSTPLACRHSFIPEYSTVFLLNLIFAHSIKEDII